MNFLAYNHSELTEYLCRQVSEHLVSAYENPTFIEPFNCIATSIFVIGVRDIN